MKKLKILSSIILIFILIAISVIPVLALGVDQLFADTSSFSSQFYAYVVVIRTSDTTIELITSPAKMYYYNYSGTLCVTVPDYQSYRRWQFTNGSWGTMSQGTGRLYKGYTGSVPRSFYNYASPKESIVLYANYNIMNQAEDTVYFGAINSPYILTGYPASSLMPGQLYPDINEYYNSDLFDGIDQIQYPYQIVYNDVSDSSMRLLISNKELKLQINDQTGNLDILAEKYTNYKRFRLDIDEWVYETGINSTEQIYTLVGSMFDSNQIFYSNYDIYDPTGIDILYDDAYNTQGQDGLVDPNIGSDESITWYEKLIDTIENILDVPSALAKLFVPKFDGTKTKISELMQTVSNKLGYSTFSNMLDDLGTLEKSTINTNLTGTLSGVYVSANFIDLSFYESMKDSIYPFFYAVMGIGLLLYNINQIFKLLNRGSVISDGVSTARKEGK